MVSSTLAVQPSLGTSFSKMSSDTLEKVPSTYTTTGKEQLQTPMSSSISSPSHYTPIWDYDRFPIEPCFRERNNRISQEHLNPFFMDYSQHHSLQGNSPGGDIVRSPSSSSVTEPGRYSHHGSRHESRHESRNASSHDLDISIFTPNTNVVSLPGSPSSASCDGANAHADPFMHTDISHYTPVSEEYDQSNSPAMISKFDQYKAQMERRRSTRVSSSSPSSPSNSRVSSLQPDSLPAASSSPTKKSARLISKLFKKSSKSKSTMSNMTQSSNPSMSSSRSSLLNEKLSPPSAPHLSVQTDSSSRSNSEKNSPIDSDGGEQQHSPLKEQQDRWRDEWLRPSGAIHSMFTDRPSKFNCPHCGAIKIVSHIQFTPGVMSYLVAFGLLFLTLGTLSFLPFRKDHKGTKDCIHWCPECTQKVARFNRANATWEWI
ncbi:hypothetical protein BGX27_001833 [Mortierella sp. AM989]|nr:hypothetical protein BGX27_001833 [Mortierella sp. AM989]